MSKLSTKITLRIAMAIPDDSPRPALSSPRNGRRNDYAVRLRASLAKRGISTAISEHVRSSPGVGVVKSLELIGPGQIRTQNL